MKARRFTQISGIFFDEFIGESAWIRDEGVIRLPPLAEVSALILRGEFQPHPAARGMEAAAPGLEVTVNGQPAGSLAALRPGAWPAMSGVERPATSNAGWPAMSKPARGRVEWELRVPLSDPGREAGTALSLQLTGVGFTNTLAWLGRVTGWGPLQRFRLQNKNRQLRLKTVSAESGALIFDFSRRHSPLAPEFARRHEKLGLNIVGFLAADLGVGESARCMVRAADAAGIPTALVPLQLHCRNRLGDTTYASRLQAENPHGVNVIHIDPPASRDIDHHHGAAFRAGKYNIAYFAWEQPEFPDTWLPSFDFFDEVWCPSDFCRAAIALKSPLPVLTMPHAIDFRRPAESVAALRARFQLPAEAFLFLTLFDLNSYTERKNPQAAIAAFRRAFDSRSGSATFESRSGSATFDSRPGPVGLVVKVQNAAANPADFAALQASLRDLPGTVLISDTLSREEIYALEAACDCFVSLHRAEGFGLALAECMFLGKPVIATDWSASAEFITGENGCPVPARIVTLESNHGPYAKGTTWAEPDIARAAEWMRQLAGDPALAKRLGAEARKTIEARFSPAVIGARYRQRLESIAMF